MSDSGNRGISSATAPGDAEDKPLRLPELPARSGLLKSNVAGRTDHLQVRVRHGAYVIPADVVSGVGEGNTLAGSKIILAMFNEPDRDMVPDAPKKAAGGAIRSKHRHRGLFAEKAKQWKRALGGRVPEVPILGAGGELVIDPEDIIRKFGDLDEGHRILDKWVVKERKNIIKTMQKLKPPVRE